MSNYLILLFTSNFYSIPLELQQKIYEEYYRLVYGLVYFIVKDHQMAEDIIQESFLRAIQKAPQLHNLRKLEAWLKALARNVALNELRKLKRNRNELESDRGFFIKETSETKAYVPLEQEVEAKLMQESILNYISALKPEYRQLIEMRWIDRLSYKEMASAMGITEGTVKLKLFRAREAIKNKLKEEWGLR